MYGTSETFKIECKLILTCNDPLIFKPDQGVKRRGILLKLRSKFVPEKDLSKKFRDADNVFPIDKTLKKWFEELEFKNAFVNLVLPYAKQYYLKGLEIPEEIENNFDELCDENDRMKTFIKETFTITESIDDRIHKSRFLNSWIEFYPKDKYMTFIKLIKDFSLSAKKGEKNIYGFDYCKGVRNSTMPSNGNSNQGCLIYLRYKNDESSSEEDTSSDEEDEEDNEKNKETNSKKKKSKKLRKVIDADSEDEEDEEVKENKKSKKELKKNKKKKNPESSEDEYYS